MTNKLMVKQIAKNDGFIAALDQSGGSTPKALKQYGIAPTAFNNDEEMYALIHDMRSRIVKSPFFTGDKVIGAILFERTMDAKIDGKDSADYLWQECGVVPFLKCDKGLADAANGVQLMKPIDGLDDLLKRAVSKNVFGTKMRSVINAADAKGISDIVDQQFEIGRQILDHGLVPIIEPEVNITIDDKAEAEQILLEKIAAKLDHVPLGQQVMLKLSLPTQSNIYRPLMKDPRVMRVVALSGGYSRTQANNLLSLNVGMIASFSRALTEGLSAQQTDREFNNALEDTIDSIYSASRAA